MSRYGSIDLIKLKAMGSSNGWNKILEECFSNLDINRIAKIRYQIQSGMDDLVKQHLNSKEMCEWFIRLNRSLEITAKRIIKIRNPMPVDNPLVAKNNSESKDAKRKRDQELANFLAKSSF